MHNYCTLVLLAIMMPSWIDCFTRTDKLSTINQKVVFATASGSTSGTVAQSPQVTEDAQKVRDVAEAVNGILFRGTGLPRIEGRTADGRQIRGIDADNVIQVAKEGKERLIKGLDKKEFAGLVAYGNKFYVIPTYESMERVGRTTEGRTLITPESNNTIFQGLIRVIKNILNIANESRLVINLTVNSQPEEKATFEIWPAYGPTRSTVTNNTLDSVYRGYYTYQVIKKGYKTIKYDLNLVEGDGRTLDCTMNKNKDSDGPTPCKHH